MKNFYDIFKQLNAIPRPSHHEEKVADYLCDFAKQHNLRYRRDTLNCVVIEKDATPGYENAEPIVILNHMDMVCVSRPDYQRNGHTFDPLKDSIQAYIEESQNEDGTTTRWMKAEGTSLGADNGVGLSMALAILADDTIVHPAIEVLTTTNEEDGMSGAEALSLDFIRGRKIINLDSEAYDEITVGAAGAYLQIGEWKLTKVIMPSGYTYHRIVIDGGLGGHSGVDINKNRCNCIKELGILFSSLFIDELTNQDILICSMNGGTANASIASQAEFVVAIKEDAQDKVQAVINEYNDKLKNRYQTTDTAVNIRIETGETPEYYISNAIHIVDCISRLSDFCGVLSMREDMPGTVMTSNNIGVLSTKEDIITLSCHTRSFDDDKMHETATQIRNIMLDCHTHAVNQIMDTPAWFERADSPLLALTCNTFKDVLGFEPKKVAMHFVLEAAYYVQKYPGVEIASIGPLIIEPHSTSERINLDTADNIWKVTVELLDRLAKQ